MWRLRNQSICDEITRFINLGRIRNNYSVTVILNDFFQKIFVFSNWLVVGKVILINDLFITLPRDLV